MAKRPPASSSGHARSSMIQPATTDDSPPSVQIASSKGHLTTTSESVTDTSSIKSKPDKLKQSKSRNGCVTCKAKRLKCDETKPSCQQCHKRGVECGGYKKDFKWRTFEETSFMPKPTTGRSKKPTTSSKAKSRDNQSAGNSPLLIGNAELKDNNNIPLEASVPSYSLNPSTTTTTLPVPNYPYNTVFTFQGTRAPDSSAPAPGPGPGPAPPYSNQFSYLPPSHSDDFEFNAPALDSQTKHDEARAGPFSTSTTTFSGRSPRINDLLTPGTVLNARPTDLQEREAVSNFQPLVNMAGDVNQVDDGEDDDVEEVIRQPEPESEAWGIYLPSPAPSNTSIDLDGSRSDLAGSLYKRPYFKPASPEMLVLRFDRNTCGVLSIKNGPRENPWRTFIWHMAVETPALYHALISMTVFHNTQERSLRMEGVEHLRRSLRLFATDIGSMRTETALATTLALAFSESWDSSIKSGIVHLRGAKALIDQALVKYNKYSSTHEEYAMLKSLINAWIYMDVTSRLTSLDTEEPVNYDQITQFLQGPVGANTELDPLLGCAHTLFPLVGRVADLARQVRMSKRNSPAIISQALQLKLQIESWKSGGSFEPPEDPYSEIEHSIQSAEAYRWATLLYLHQTVPEIPSMTTEKLAEKVLVCLSKIPMSSGAVVVHIYPLFLAGTEVVRPEHRKWVKERWEGMISRLWVGLLQRCWDATQAVWLRRDRFEEGERVKRLRRQYEIGVPACASVIGKRKFDLVDGAAEELVNAPPNVIPNMVQRETRVTVLNRSGIPTPIEPNDPFTIKLSTTNLDHSPEILPFERTIRGKVHWAGVMRDWKWEVMLG